MADELTIGELGRRLDAGLLGIKDDIRELAIRVDGKVDAQVLLLQQQAQDERHKALAEQVAARDRELQAQIAAMRKDQEEDKKRLQEMRRWLIGVVVVPILAVILPILLTRGKL